MKAKSNPVAEASEQVAPPSEAGPELLALPTANAEAASFHFQRLLVRVPVDSTKILRPDGSLDYSSPDWQILAHELTHYAQAVSTVLGQRIVMNWIAVQVRVAKELLRVSPLPVPLYDKTAQETPGVSRAIWEFHRYFAEANALVGSKHGLRSAEEAGRAAEYTLYNYVAPHPRDGAKDTQVAISMRDDGGRPFGVPILGDMLTEGMAQIVQWMAKSADIDERLGVRPIAAVAQDGGSYDIYYTALARLIRARFPQWDCRMLSLCIADAALCARKVGVAVAEILRHIENSSPPVDVEGYRELRRRLDSLPTVAEGRSSILKQIAEVEAGIPENAQGLGPHFRRVLQLFKEAWRVRQTDPAILIDSDYREAFLQTVVSHLGAPPIFFNDKDHFLRLQTEDHAGLELAFLAMRGTFDILSGLAHDGLTKECTLLRTQMCKHRKTEACRKDILSIPIDSDGKSCVMAFAATCLGLYGRPLKRYGESFK